MRTGGKIPPLTPRKSRYYHNPIMKTINEELTDSLKAKGASPVGFANLSERKPR